MHTRVTFLNLLYVLYVHYVHFSLFYFSKSCRTEDENHSDNTNYWIFFLVVCTVDLLLDPSKEHSKLKNIHKKICIKSSYNSDLVHIHQLFVESTSLSTFLLSKLLSLLFSSSDKTDKTVTTVLNQTSCERD